MRVKKQLTYKSEKIYIVSVTFNICQLTFLSFIKAVNKGMHKLWEVFEKRLISVL